ncbi:MAG: hypothetical protein ACI90V_007245, partial [Bacillariaceae sp.]
KTQVGTRKGMQETQVGTKIAKTCSGKDQFGTCS